ncbi:MAG: DNA polymerase III subunit alpha, partial [Bacteroidales bacterium]
FSLLLIDVLNIMYGKFMEGCEKKGYDKKICEKIWEDWKAFAEYAFNKSHSTCYAYVAYQTGYLKANFPAEFMAAVLSSNLGNMDKISIAMEECRRLGLSVVVPDVNESKINFIINKKGQIQFGLGAIKGVGEAASESIIEERKKGTFKDIYDFIERVNLRTINKKCMENLVMSGALDSFGIKRWEYFAKDENEPSFIERLLKFGTQIQNSSANSVPSLFGDAVQVEIVKPKPTSFRVWEPFETFKNEKEVIGMFVSGNPLDEYKMVMDVFCKKNTNDLKDNLSELSGTEFYVGGIITKTREKKKENGSISGFFTLEDYVNSIEIPLFGKDYHEFFPKIEKNIQVAVKCKVEPLNYKDNKTLNIKVVEIKKLEELKEQIKRLTIKIKAQDVSNDLLLELDSYTNSENNGSGIQLAFLIWDPQEKIWIEMISKSYKINLTKDLIDLLDNTSSIDYKLN